MEHVKYLQPWGRNEAVKIDCTCGQSHGLCSFRNPQMALESGHLAPGDVTQWANNPRVNPLSEKLGRSQEVIATVNAAWHSR